MTNIDEKLKKDVVDALCTNDQFDASTIAVKVDNGVIEMTGSVSSSNERELAERIAKSIPQAGTIKNHLAIIQDSMEDPRSHIA